MIDLRLYRYALLAVPLAAVIAMFSLQSVPAPLSGGVPPDAFDPATAAPLAKQLAETAAYPTPGSAADNAMAEQVKQQFSAIDGRVGLRAALQRLVPRARRRSAAT